MDILLQFMLWPSLVVAAYGLQILKMTAGSPRFSRVSVPRFSSVSDTPSDFWAASEPEPFLQPQQMLVRTDVAASELTTVSYLEPEVVTENTKTKATPREATLHVYLSKDALAELRRHGYVPSQSKNL